ncbi:uncharacterized protein A4U43_C09F16040 [Asparagus officinalis]|uniref:EF-hand domain-containing protein n=1 Tax=Asparagus officinalis TaxID=4686 RepID=A0A5P1EB85_ASPOF|nr:uncharacterized protein A4U43_C09F16040 [Asparagus officinalis]
MERARNDQITLSGPINPQGKRDTETRKMTRFNTMPKLSTAGAPLLPENPSIITEQRHLETIPETCIKINLNESNGTVGNLKVKTSREKLKSPEEARGTSDRRSNLASLLRSTASPRFRHASRELKKLALRPKWSLQGKADHGPKSAAAKALKGLVFISKTGGFNGWPAVEKRFDELAEEGVLPKSLFAHCIGMRESKEFAGVLFDALSRRKNITSSSITKDQLKVFWDQISDQSFDSRLQTFFDMVDQNADGRITEDEVREIISLSASANKLSKIQEKAEEYARLVMEELDPDNLGYVEIHNLETLLLQAPSQSVVRGNSEFLSQMLSAKLRPTKEPNPLRRWCQHSKYFLEDNWQRVWVMMLWLSICAGLFTWKFFQFRQRAVFNVLGYCVCTAKGAAETLKFNMALILLTVCRNTITWLRNTKLGSFVPFDDNLNFHKVIALGITVGTIFHAGPLIACNYTRRVHNSNFWWFINNIEGNSGILMVVLMTIAFILATPWFRRGRMNLPKPLKKLTGFNAFWYSHHLFVVVYILHIIHGVSLYFSKTWLKKTTWMYVAIPLIVYAAERLIRAFRSTVRPVKILKVAVYPGNVLALQFSKPHGFKYKSGQYIFVNCAAVSPFQCFPRVLVDGPYGAPAQNYKKYEVVLLVGLGIGATPFISILKDIVNNMKVQDDEAVANAQHDLERGGESDSSNGSFSRQTSKRGSRVRSYFKTRRAYFYWMTREQDSFEWFRGVMNEVAETDKKGAIELHNHCTSVYEEGDARSALIAMLQSLHHAKSGLDVVSGTHVKSHFARPNWRNVYKRIALNHPDQRVGVFYCGAAALTNQLRQIAVDFSRKTTTKFDFHKENF